MKDQLKKELEDKCFNYEVDPSTGGLALDIEDAEYLINKAFKEGEKKGREDERKLWLRNVCISKQTNQIDD